MSGGKICKECGEYRDYSLYHRHPNGINGLASKCKACRCAYSRKYRRDNLKKAKENNKKWKINNPEKVALIRKRQKKKAKEKTHRYHIKREYGMSSEQYEYMLLEQGGVCAANGCHEIMKHGRLSVDHCHKTGRIRGLLCSQCNTTLGRVGDSIEKLKGLISYLERANLLERQENEQL